MALDKKLSELESLEISSDEDEQDDNETKKIESRFKRFKKVRRIFYLMNVIPEFLRKFPYFASDCSNYFICHKKKSLRNKFKQSENADKFPEEQVIEKIKLERAEASTNANAQLIEEPIEDNGYYWIGKDYSNVYKEDIININEFSKGKLYYSCRVCL
jgi:hypothetical protein